MRKPNVPRILHHLAITAGIVGIICAICLYGALKGYIPQGLSFAIAGLVVGGAVAHWLSVLASIHAETLMSPPPPTTP